LSELSCGSAAAAQRPSISSCYLSGWSNYYRVMALDQLKAFLAKMQEDRALRQSVLAAATADDVAKIGAKGGFSFSGDELLRLSGQKVGRVTITKQDIPGEYN